MSEAYSFSKFYYFFVLKPLSLRSLSDFEDFSVSFSECLSEISLFYVSSVRSRLMVEESS